MLDTSKIINQFYLFRQTFIKSFFHFFSFLLIKIYLSIIFLLNLALWLFSFFIVNNIGQEEMALHYSVDFGVDLYGAVGKIYFIPFLALVFIIINIAIILVIIRYDPKNFRFISHLLLGTTVVASIILLTAITSIYIINFL